MREATEMGREEFTCQATQAKCSKVESLISQRDRLTAENQELKRANACGAGVYEDMCDIIFVLQSHLDKISEPEQLYREKKAYICASDIVKYDIHSRVKAYLDSHDDFQCPECGGTRQKRVQYCSLFVTPQAVYSYYHMYERCPRCKGKGKI